MIVPNCAAIFLQSLDNLLKVLLCIQAMHRHVITLLFFLLILICCIATVLVILRVVYATKRLWEICSINDWHGTGSILDASCRRLSVQDEIGETAIGLRVLRSDICPIALVQLVMVFVKFKSVLVSLVITWRHGASVIRDPAISLKIAACDVTEFTLVGSFLIIVTFLLAFTDQPFL